MKLYETINASNWTKGTTLDEEGRQCLGGWLFNSNRVACWNDLWECVAAIRALYPERVNPIISDLMAVWIFNDHPDTTVEDVIRVCKVANR